MNRRDVIARMGATLAGLAGGAASAQDALLTAEEQAWVDKHPVLLFAPERDFPPFSFVDSQGQHRGLSADVLDLVQAHTGLKFQAVAASDRGNDIDRLKRREVDLLTSLRPTTEREQSISFTSAYVSSPAVVLRRRGDHRTGDLAKMQGERLAVDRSSAAETFVRDTYPDVTLVQVDVAAQGLRDLVFGDVDACAVNLATASYVIERDRLGGLRVAGETGYFCTLTLGYRKDWPMLGRVLEKGLAQISEAERAQMIARWIPLTDIAWWQRPEVQRVLGTASIGTGLLMGGLLLWNRALRRAVAQRTDALQKELAERQRATLALTLKFANLPAPKRLEDFDFAAQPGLDRRLVDELATGRFLAEGRNVILLGPPGVGKTHLAIALLIRAAELGHRAYFSTALDLARRLSKAVAENRLHRQLGVFTQPKLLALDEIGYLALDPVQASLLFQLLARRYERGQPTVLTSNKPFGEWGQVFGGDAVLASAALDRLLHRATVLQIRGDSYRLRERRLAGLPPPAQP